MEIICPTCNAKYNIPEERLPRGKRGSATCKKCGNKIVIEPVEENLPDRAPVEPGTEPSDGHERPNQITENEFSSFIGPNSEKYLSKFKKFGMPDVDSFSITWHWPAFFVSFFWMLYRKLYLWALLLFVLSFIPGVGLLLMIAFGLTGNYIYYRYAKAKIIGLKRQQPSADISSSLSMIGGVNNWVKVLAIILVVLSILGILAAVIIPILAVN